MEGLGDRVGHDHLAATPGPDQAAAGEHEHQPDPGEQAGQREPHLERAVGDGANPELSDQTVRRTSPGLLTSRTLDRMLTIETGPVAPIDRELIGTGGERLAVVLD